MTRVNTFVFSLVLLALPGLASADEVVGTGAGYCPVQLVSFQAGINFTPTGGNFNAGTGTAVVRFVLENTSGVEASNGNSVLTRFFFRVPAGTGVSYDEARILAGSTVRSTNAEIGGETVPPGCQVLAADLVKTNWYEMSGQIEVGQFGFFSNAVTTDEEAIKGGLVDPDVFVGCVAQGPVHSPLVVAGRVQFTVSLSGLNTSMDSAQDFLSFCSANSHPSDSQFAAKYQGTGQGGGGSCFVGECPTPARPSSWGGLKATYR